MVTDDATRERSGVLLVLVSCPAGKAEDIAVQLIDSELAACINVIPGIQSIYRWKGKVEQDTESLMLIKCPAGSYPELEAHILDAHPYELPEIVTVSELGGLTAYLEWILDPDKNNSE